MLKTIAANRKGRPNADARTRGAQWGKSCWSSEGGPAGHFQPGGADFAPLAAALTRAKGARGRGGRAAKRGAQGSKAQRRSEAERAPSGDLIGRAPACNRGGAIAEIQRQKERRAADAGARAGRRRRSQGSTGRHGPRPAELDDALHVPPLRRGRRGAPAGSGSGSGPATLPDASLAELAPRSRQVRPPGPLFTKLRRLSSSQLHHQQLGHQQGQERRQQQREQRTSDTVTKKAPRPVRRLRRHAADLVPRLPLSRRLVCPEQRPHRSETPLRRSGRRASVQDHGYAFGS
eukprot:gene9071-biopygen10616